MPAEFLCLQNPSACRIPLPTESLAEIKVSLRPENHLSILILVNYNLEMRTKGILSFSISYLVLEIFRSFDIFGVIEIFRVFYSNFNCINMLMGTYN